MELVQCKYLHMDRFKLVLPGSSANVGPGFDVFSVALTFHLYVSVEVDRSHPSAGLDGIEIEQEMLFEEEQIPAFNSPRKNLIALTIGFLAGLNGRDIPKMKIECRSEILTGIGLGSSGAAIVAGACIASKVFDLGLTREDLLTYCTLIEGSPDNVSSSIYGSFTVSYDNADPTEYIKSVETYLANLSATGDHTLNLPESVPRNLLSVIEYPFSIDFKFIVLVSRRLRFNTKEMRQILPDNYSMKDLVKTVRNTSLLLSCIGGHVSKDKIPVCLSTCLKDVVHQNYRVKFIPGGRKILDLKHGEIEGLIGAYLSGSGPSFQVLATHNFDEIGKTLVKMWQDAALQEGKEISCYYMVSSLCTQGARLVDDF